MSRLTEYREDLKRYEYKQDEKGYCYISEGQIVNKLGKLEDLEEEIGCPLDVRCKVVKNTSIFAELGYRKISNEWLVGEISSDGFICWQKYAIRRYFWKDYKKTWWLKKNREE